MKLSSLILTVLVTTMPGPANAQREVPYEPTAADAVKAKELAAKVVGELAANCPVKPLNDMDALKACRATLFRDDSAFRTSLKSLTA